MAVFIGAVKSEKKPKQGEFVLARWNDNMQWTKGILKGETKNGFEVYDFGLKDKKYIEFYAQIAIEPYPYGKGKIWHSNKWKNRNYKNYHFTK